MVYTIRNVKAEDLDQVTEVEALCFPAAEAATGESFRTRIETFPESFLVAEDESGKIIGFINGCVTDERTIRDEMFEDSGLHRADGMYQSIFGLDVIPEYRRQGVAADLMNHLIQTAKARGKKGMIDLAHRYSGYSAYGCDDADSGGGKGNESGIPEGIFNAERPESGSQ